jgi:hypothetical protein
MKQQTAVQWLIEQTRKPEWKSLQRGDILEQAKEMEREQILKAHFHGLVHQFDNPIEASNDYYNSIYN